MPFYLIEMIEVINIMNMKWETLQIMLYFFLNNKKNGVLMNMIICVFW